MNQYEFEGVFHYIYDDFAEFREHQPLADYYKFYWHAILREGQWTSTSDGYIVELVRKITNQRTGTITHSFPFKTIRIKKHYDAGTKSYIYKPDSKLYYSQLLKKPILTTRDHKIGGLTKKQLNEILALVKIGKDPFVAIQSVAGKNIPSNKLYDILTEISIKEPYIMEQILTFVDKIDQAVHLKSGKSTEDLIVDTVASLLTDVKLPSNAKRENILFYLKLKHLTPREILGFKGKSLREINTAEVPPLLE